MPRLRKTRLRVAHEVGVAALLLEHVPHAFEHARVDVARAVAEIRRHLPLHLGAVHEVPLVIHLVDHPHVPRDGDLLTRRRRHHDRADLLRIRPHRVLLVLLEHGVELKIVDDALAREAHDESAALGDLDMVDLNEVTQQHAIVIG